jgi:hypothetical protein
MWSLGDNQRVPTSFATVPNSTSAPNNALQHPKRKSKKTSAAFEMSAAAFT